MPIYEHPILGSDCKYDRYLSRDFSTQEAMIGTEMEGSGTHCGYEIVRLRRVERRRSQVLRVSVPRRSGSTLQTQGNLLRSTGSYRN